MFQDTALKPLLTEESYTLHGKEAQHFFVNKLYTAARRGDKFRELVQDVFENVRSTICVGWDALVEGGQLAVFLFRYLRAMEFRVVFPVPVAGDNQGTLESATAPGTKAGGQPG